MESHLHEAYSQTDIHVPEEAEVAQFSHLHIPKSALDDPIIFPAVRRIHDAMLNLMSPSNSLLIQYEASMDTTTSCVIPKNVMFNATEEHPRF